MTFAVPYDGSELSKVALVRAGEYGKALEEDVVAVSVIPAGSDYALEKGWIDDRSEFDVDGVASQLMSEVTSFVPTAGFRYETLERRPPQGAVANAIRRMAHEVDAAVVFLGSDDAGQVVTPVTSVGGGVAADEEYDVHIVRSETPTDVAGLRIDSAFYDSEG